jgi:membrane protein DedA with SNARE-associated domain
VAGADIAPAIVGRVLTHLAIHVGHHAPRVDLVGLALAAAVSWIGVTGPGEVALVGAGIAASRGHPAIGSVIAFAWCGATVGGVGGWLAGRYGGRRIVLAGRWLHGMRERALEKGNRFFEQRYGLVAVYFAPSWVAGINRMSAARFLPANALCALVWALLLGLGSYALGPSIRDISADVGLVGTLVIVAVAVAAAVLRRLGMRRRAQSRRPRSNR